MLLQQIENIQRSTNDIVRMEIDKTMFGVVDSNWHRLVATTDIDGFDRLISFDLID